jgi:hypothetical protein
MFPAIMPWPMTLAHTNETVRSENRVEKNLDMEKIIIREFMKDVRIVLLSKKRKILWE